MTEPQPMPRAHYQPPRERLALLLDQLSEFEPDADKRSRLDPAPEKKPESKLRFEAASAPRPRLEPVPIRKPEPEVAPVEVEQPVLESARKAASKSAKKPAAKPASKSQVRKVAPRQASPTAKAKSQPKPQAKPLVKSKPLLRSKPPLKSKPKETPASFHAVLRSYAKDQVRLSPQAQAKIFRPESSVSPWASLTQRGVLGTLIRGFSWLNSKYKTTASKRLRLSEVVQLGDKRFVALVKVEDREFLIGGASSGVSLLSPLDVEGATVEIRKRGIGSGGKSR